MKNKKFRFTNTIFAKMLSGYIASTLLTVLLASALSFFLIGRYIVGSNQDDLLDKALNVAQMAGRNRSLSVSRFYEIEELCDAQLIYISADLKAQRLPARQSEDAGFELMEIINAMDIELFKSILSGTAATDVRRLEFMGKDVVFAGAPILSDSGAVQGAFILYRPLTDLDDTVTSLVSIEAMAGIGALIFASFVAWALSRYLTRPLSRLRATAQRVAAGEYGERFDIRQRDEIGQLGETLNLLSSRLQSVIGNLRDEKSKLEQILAGIGEGLVAVDLSGAVVHINAPALSLLELPGGFEDAVSGAKSRLLNSLDAVMRTVGRETEIWTNASGVTVEATLTPILGADQNAMGAVALLRDISEPVRLEQMRRDYIANISHELRTPLTGIRGMTEPLIDGLMETEQQRMDSYTIIYQETLRLERLIGDMLDLSRLQDGRMEMTLEPMEPEGLVEAAMRRFTARAAEKNVRLSFEPPAGNISVMGDETRSIQVLTIFLDNAMRFSESGGSILLSIRRNGQKAVFAVRDDGPGIDPKDLPYIWERFYKADKSRTGSSGTGLGLAIAKLIVELMGGEISAESAPGQGASFSFALSLAKPE